MTIIDIKEKLLNKKWDITDLIFLLLFIVLACTFLTPILGIIRHKKAVSLSNLQLLNINFFINHKTVWIKL